MPRPAAETPPLRLAVAGLGAIGLTVARQVDQGAVPGMMLTAVAARDQEKARRNLAGLRQAPEIRGLADLAEAADVILECAPAAVFRELAEPALAQGRSLVILSVGALLRHMDLVELAQRQGGRIIVPTGALIGLDAVRAAAQGEIKSVRLETRKPPGGLAGAPYLEANKIELEGITEPQRIFAGSARDAAKGFPANVNVAAALALAGIGPDRTTVEIWADPTVTRNTHSITVESDSADFTMSIRNIPTEENPRTGRITALSALAALQRLTAPLAVGT